MPGVRYLRSAADGGPLKGGAPRAVWDVLGTDPHLVSASSAAQRLDQGGVPCHLVWNPLNGEIVQLVSIVRAARSLGVAQVHAEGRICAQIVVVGLASEPFTDGPLAGLREIMMWLDSWGISRTWPAGGPAPLPESHLSSRCRRRWARGGHFGVSQVPGVSAAGPGAIDTERLTGWPGSYSAADRTATDFSADQAAAARYDPPGFGEFIKDHAASSAAAALSRVR
jgi:hypothetical protein